MKIATTDTEKRQAVKSRDYRWRLDDILDSVEKWSRKAERLKACNDMTGYYDARFTIDLLLDHAKTVVDILNDIGWYQPARLQCRNTWDTELRYELFLQGELARGYNCNDDEE